MVFYYVCSQHSMNNYQGVHVLRGDRPNTGKYFYYGHQFRKSYVRCNDPSIIISLICHENGCGVKLTVTGDANGVIYLTTHIYTTLIQFFPKDTAIYRAEGGPHCHSAIKNAEVKARFNAEINKAVEHDTTTDLKTLYDQTIHANG